MALIEWGTKGAWPVVRWSLIGAWVGILCGLASAGFLLSLDHVTQLRESQPGLLFGLPIAGALVGFLYYRFGSSVERGNNLLLERVHEPDGELPVRMAPLVLIGTLVTHLCGGSAGREGTAVQMGGSLAHAGMSWLPLKPEERRLVIMAGIAGGFSSVFGTPLAGAVFGMEVLVIGQVTYAGLVPCLAAAVVGDWVTKACGVHHSAYHVTLESFQFTPLQVLLALGVGLASGLTSRLFVYTTETISHTAKRVIQVPWLRPFVGGLLFIALYFALNGHDYLGLSLPLLHQAFDPSGVPPYAFLLKLLFTAVTLGTGFKGGEVTPLFGIGATLGSAVAGFSGQPRDIFAAIGFVAVFGAAANTPLACIIMGIELFGAHTAIPLALGCVVAYVVSGHRGIYHAQGLGIRKR